MRLSISIFAALALVAVARGSDPLVEGAARAAKDLAPALRALEAKQVSVEVTDAATGASSLSAPAVRIAFASALKPLGIAVESTADVRLLVRHGFAVDPDTRPTRGAVKFDVALRSNGRAAGTPVSLFLHGDDTVARLCSTPGTVIVPADTDPADRGTLLSGGKPKGPPPPPKLTMRLLLLKPGTTDQYEAVVPTASGYATLPANRTYIIEFKSADHDYALDLSVDSIAFTYFAKDADDHERKILVKGGGKPTYVRGWYCDAGQSRKFDTAFADAPVVGVKWDEVGKIVATAHRCFPKGATIPKEFAVHLAHRSVGKLYTDFTTVQADKFEYEDVTIVDKIAVKLELTYGPK